jgi:RNA polymerase sigma-70 factor (ECF subfamily)
VTFEEMVECYHKRLCGWFNRRTHNPDIVDDLVQETYLHLWRHRHRITEWTEKILFYVARQRLIDYYRKRRISYTSLEEVATVVVYEQRFAVNEDDVEVILQMASSLHREVLMLVVDGWHYEEIAALLGIKVGTVKSRLNSGRREIGERLTGKAPVLKKPKYYVRNSKLSAEEVLLISISTERGVVLAEMYGVDKSTISRIRKGRRWSQVTTERTA